jgi:hypothetical protein
MLTLYDKDYQLIYEETRNQTIDFYSTDSKTAFLKNYISFGKSWRYHKPSIEYKFNSLGYRTKEITDLNKDFLLTFGCSYSEGVGLHQSELWCEDISKHLNIDLYNHAKQATGIDIQYYNAMLWNMNQMPKPKLVIVQWPYKARKSFGFRKKNCIDIRDMSETPTADGKWWDKRYIQDSGEMELNVLFWIESFNNVWKLAGVPVLNFTWDNDLSEHLERSKYQMFYIKNKNRDKARDQIHDGPLFHAETSAQLKGILKLSNFTDKV